MIKHTVLATAAVLGLASFGMSPAAFAQSGGGGGGAVPNQAPAENILAAAPSFDVGSQGYQRFDGPVIGMFNNQVVPENGSEGGVQTANSLPLGSSSVSVPTAQFENNRVVAVTSGHLMVNNGSGISQTAASMPPGAMQGTVPQTTSTITSRYVAAKQTRELASRAAAERHAALTAGPRG